MSKETEKDHPDQAVDTPLPSTKVNKKAFEAMREAWLEENPEEDES